MSSPVAIRDAPVTAGRARSFSRGCRRAPKGSTSVTHVGLRLSCAIRQFGSAPGTLMLGLRLSCSYPRARLQPAGAFVRPGAVRRAQRVPLRLLTLGLRLSCAIRKFSSAPGTLMLGLRLSCSYPRAPVRSFQSVVDWKGRWGRARSFGRGLFVVHRRVPLRLLMLGLRLSCCIRKFGSAPVTPQERA